MSLTGNATPKEVLRGSIHGLDILTISAYGIAVKNGFKGTEKEWLESLKGEKGDNGDAARISEVTIYASAWVKNSSVDNLYFQEVTIDGITEYSKVDLLPSVAQLAIFHNKDVAFVTENEDGIVTVFAIGEKPVQDYTMQVQITEVSV